MQIDTSVFLLIPGDTPRYVYGKVTDMEDGPWVGSSYSVMFDESAGGKPGDNLKLYYQFDSTFWCQPSKITASEESEVGNYVTLEVTTKPRKEEHRRSSRTDAYLAGVTAAVHGKPECLVINVSDKGLAIATNEQHEVGAFVDAEVRWNGEVWVGKMTVKHEKESAKESRIYGLECSRAKDGDTLRDGLKRIAATVAFQQGVMEEVLSDQLER